jgi:AcrR family transcriptional regulator
MARPSRNIDRLLLATGRELLPETGCRNLSIRQVTERAGVNLGMFHYHFKTRDKFVRAVLQEMYEDMFASLELEQGRHRNPGTSLRAVLTLLGRFARDHRRLLLRVMSDALSGDDVALAFARENLPRHLAIIATLVQQGQASGAFRPLPVPQAMAFLAAAVAMPLIFGAAIEANAASPPAGVLLTDTAIDQRVDMALAGLALPKRNMARKAKEER